ncbi:hypothetical protein DQW50_16410 [Halorubrum sp. 48-1-W]|uniref:hypothetical protein n=1 Tax=Halorubrum sp. 48-1-W TaxID=2249761 RepID=UPI000DCC8681|nr:hypothetical protein [Halorubrum sp. 48-1-W]RAW44040.1 hypothetical protein DQW50_16410 [Halorubrum sp. 48-1-W]
MVPEPLDVSKYRAIMTTTDRERISGEVDVSDEKRYQAIHRVRSRIEEIETDVDVLKEHHPELFEELQKAVCDDE